MTSKLFRKVSIERLSSPEQLDTLLRVTSFKTWLALVGVMATLGATLVWGITGSIPTTTAGQGLIVRRGGVLNVVSRGGGIVLEMRAKPGDRIRPNQVIATLAQPVLAERLRSTRSAMEEAVRRREQNLSVQKNSADLQVAAIERQRTAIDQQIRQLQEKGKNITEQIHAEELLLAKGLVTRQQVLAVLRTLPDEYRLPLTLRYLAGADYETISRQLGLSNGSLRGLLNRGMTRLREEVARAARS